jgi:hypothetical protein
VVVQAIPTYSMGVFQLPVSLCKEINKLMQDFWWQHMSQGSKIHWMSWERMGRSKAVGGLGFRDLVMFNKALLAKQGWRLLQDPSSLLASILKAKHFPNSNFLGAKLGSRPSFAWRSLFNAHDLLLQGIMWRVGDGTSINIWGDKWLLTLITYAVQSPPKTLAISTNVVVLIDPVTKGWKEELIKVEFSEDEAKVISGIPLSPDLPPDRMFWRGTIDGKFTVRSADHLGKETEAMEAGQCYYVGEGAEVWKAIWALQVPNSVKLFIWRACHNILPTRLHLT